MVAALLGLGVSGLAWAQVFDSPVGAIRVETVARGLEHPWALVFLDDGQMLVGERPGRLRRVAADGRLSEPFEGLPKIKAQRQGGLLDLLLEPRSDGAQRLYFCFSEPGEQGTSGTAVARARIDPEGRRLYDLEVIWRQTPKRDAGIHFGCRLVWAADGRLFVTLGDRGDREQAQRLDNTLGKVVRIEPDGRIPPDNPFQARGGVAREIWSYGHRNIQGAVLDPRSGMLWTHEHGPRGGDEVNLTRAGHNYGWPEITYGREYHGPKIGPTAKDGMEQPAWYWDPSIAPSGMLWYDGADFPSWRGSLLLGGMVPGELIRLELQGERIVREERVLRALRERIRSVYVGPDGALYLLTDTPRGRILRLRPGAPPTPDA